MDAAAQVHAAFVPVRRAELGGEGRVALSAWSPAIDVCAVVASDGQLAVHRMNWQQLWAVAPEAPVTALAWRPDGKLLATGHADGSLAVWDVETGEPVARHARAHFAPVTALDWSLTPATARIDRDDDRWAGCFGGGGGRRGSDADADAIDADARPPFFFNAAASSATAATYEDRQPRLFPADGLVLVSSTGGAPDTANAKEDPYAELFRGAPPPLPRDSADADAAAAAAAATWEVGATAASSSSPSSSSPPLDLLCAADRRGCLSAWVGAGRVQVGDVAGLAPRVAAAAAVAAAREGGGEDEDDDNTPAPPPPPPPTLVALSTAADQSACVSVAWHPPAAADNDNGAKPSTSSSTTTTTAGLAATPLATRPLRAARREVRHWARLHWRLRGLLESAGLALQSASREWASASSNLRKRVLDELAEALAAHSADGDGGEGDGGDGDGNGDNTNNTAVRDHDPRAELMLLLATGTATPGVHAWLTGSLGEAGVQRAARAVDAALQRAHALLLHGCLPALERAAFALGELRGFAAATCPAAAGSRGRGALLGLRPEDLERLEAAAVRAVVRAEQVRLATGRLAAQHRALFTWLLRTARQLESAASAAVSASGAAENNNNDPAAANRPPPEPPAGPDAALADVLLPFLDEGGPLGADDPLAPELLGAAPPLDARQRRAARRWLHGDDGGCGGGGGGGAGAETTAKEDLGPEAVVDRVLRILYPLGRDGAGGAAAAAAEAGGGEEDALALAVQVAALAEACEEALAAPQSSVSAHMTVGQPVLLAPARCFVVPADQQQQQQQQQQPLPPPRVAVAPAGGGDGARGGDEAAAAGGGGLGNNGNAEGQEDGVVICVVVPAAGLAAIRAKQEEQEQGEGEAADGVLVVCARAVPANGGHSDSDSPAPPSNSLELRLSAVLVRGDPGARVVDAAPYKDGQLAVLSSSSPGGGASHHPHAASVDARAPPVLALLDLSSAPFVAVAGPGATAIPASTTITTTTTALEACLAAGAVVDAADLAAAGCVRAAQLAGFAAAVAPLAVSRARGLALVLSDMQRLAVLDVDADEEGVEEEEGQEEEEV